MEWTAAQEQVLAHQAGWLQVRGPAGSGKTSVLVRRWQQLAHQTEQPERLLVLCRSRAGADDFRRSAMGERWWAAESLPFTTPYGAAFDLVRRHRGERRLLTRVEQWTIVRRMLAEDDRQRWPSCPDFVHRAAFVDEVAAAVVAVEASGATDEAVLVVAGRAGEGDRWADVLAFRGRYRRVTTAMAVLDGAQLFSEANEILRDDSVAAAEAARWDEVLVDDAEHLSDPMGRLVERLAGRQLVAGGDDAGPIAEPSGSPSVAPMPWFDRCAWPSSVHLGHRHRAAIAPVLVACRHPSMEPEAIAAVLLESHAEGVAWRDMAVLMRSDRQRAQSIGRALSRHGIPARMAHGAAAAEPAVRALLDFFAWAAGDVGARGRLLVSPAVDFGPGELRRRLRIDSRGGVPLADDPRVARLEALRASLAPRLASGDPASLAHEAWLTLLGGLVAVPGALGDGIDDQALDAVVAFLDEVSQRAAHDPSLRIADELALVDGPDFDVEPWLPAASPDDCEKVTVTTIWSAAGRAWDTVVIAGCLEGELPRVSGASRFFDRAVPEQAGRAGDRELGGALPTLAQRRRASLAEEQRLFATAISRARHRLVTTSAPAPGQLVSRFVADAPQEALRPIRPRMARGALGLTPAAETESAAPVHGDGRLRLSASRLLTYDDCPRRYFYQYELSVRDNGGVAASMGTIVHAALAAYLDPSHPVERSWPALEDLALALWDADLSETIAPYQPMREQARRDIFSMLQDWWNAEDAKAEAAGAWPDVVAVEYSFDIEVGAHRVRGSIDRIDRVAGGIAIIDYKTGSKAPRPAEVAEDLQLATYHLAAVRDPVLAALGEPVSLQLCYLRSGAWPSQPITVDHAARTEQRILATADRILSEDFEPSVEADCEYCDFWRLCPLQAPGRQVTGE